MSDGTGWPAADEAVALLCEAVALLGELRKWTPADEAAMWTPLEATWTPLGDGHYSIRVLDCGRLAEVSPGGAPWSEVRGAVESARREKRIPADLADAWLGAQQYATVN